MDGLPVVPPTPQQVEAMVATLGMDAVEPAVTTHAVSMPTAELIIARAYEAVPQAIRRRLGR